MVTIWEHEWDKMVKDEPDLKVFVKTYERKTPLDPRDAFFGGRTNATKLHHKCKENEKIKYYDVTSL